MLGHLDGDVAGTLRFYKKTEKVKGFGIEERTGRLDPVALWSSLKAYSIDNPDEK